MKTARNRFADYCNNELPCRENQATNLPILMTAIPSPEVTILLRPSALGRFPNAAPMRPPPHPCCHLATSGTPCHFHKNTANHCHKITYAKHLIHFGTLASSLLYSHSSKADVLSAPWLQQGNDKWPTASRTSKTLRHVAQLHAQPRRLPMLQPLQRLWRAFRILITMLMSKSRWP